MFLKGNYHQTSQTHLTHILKQNRGDSTGYNHNNNL